MLGSHDLPVKCVEHNTATGLVVSGGWDSTLRLWDARSPDGPGRCVGQLQLPGRVYAMATSNKRLVVATADKRIQIYDLRSLRAGAAPLQQRESPLKYQIRTLRCMPDGRGYAASSVEGRVALDFFDDAESTASRYAFKCHRRTEGGKETVYPVNALGASLRPWMPHGHSLTTHPPRVQHSTLCMARLPQEAVTATSTSGTALRRSAFLCCPNTRPPSPPCPSTTTELCWCACLCLLVL